MTELLDLYLCETCGNIIQVMHSSYGELVCCNKPMKKLTPQTITQEESLKEKHVPVFNGTTIQVGSVIHPMNKEHHIEFIQIYSDDKKHTQTVFLSPEDTPKITSENNNYNHAVEYCNLHGLWLGDK